MLSVAISSQIQEFVPGTQDLFGDIIILLSQKKIVVVLETAMNWYTVHGHIIAAGVKTTITISIFTVYYLICL